MPAEITPEEQLDYAVSSSRLMLWFAREWLKTHPAEWFQDTIRKRTDIWRRTDFNPDHIDGKQDGFTHGWLDMLSALERVYNETAGQPDSREYEDRCIELLLPHFKGRVARDIQDHLHSTQFAAYQCGSLRYDLNVNPNAPRRISFHIANACYPGSLFADRQYLPACLLVLCIQCEAKFGVAEISTGTWLNSLEKWLELFPQEWRDHLSAPAEDIWGHYGFWGQFITSRRAFHHKLGEQFRTTGKLPYAPRSSWCSIAALRQHLQKNYFSAQA